MEFKCNTNIILGYLHSPTKHRRNTIPAPYCDNILNHDTNDDIIKLVTLMVKHNKIITKMTVLQVHIRTLLNKPYTINLVSLTILSF